ncbi:anhydro-N-acetylmuramic acid kinase [Coxiella burnetii]|uniref:anhydro-N-acetylmuramic acid kinase n=1 Tax=Coxiella burnetii TaxID=777 RepID=UPI000CCC3BB3|nr:anhydro-N-acetylmuramic acid kinase [Coxiella burnetii]PNT89269.1 anhydro-N-acetylmuramic acid kinase [Coxiella burnetii]
MPKERYIGLISGTSMDALDTALVQFDPLKIIATHGEPIPTELKKNLVALSTGTDNSIPSMGETDVALGRIFGEAVLTLLEKAKVSSDSIQAIGSHGQTIRHMPNGKHPFTLQIGDPNTIAALTGITTVADFRRRDMALGGQGAPLAPAFHEFLLRDQSENRLILNIGGIANLTFLPRDPEKSTIGFDTGPGNTLLDAWCLMNLNKDYDDQGQWAASGRVQEKLVAQLLAEPYFQTPPPKSTGREYFNLNWLKKNLNGEKFDPVDIQATLVELTARSVANCCRNFSMDSGSLWLCGGGARNHHLVNRLKVLCKPLRVTTTEEIGIHPDWLEAVCFAWLAKQTLEKKPGNLPSVTGAKKSAILGAIYWGEKFNY